MDKLNDDKGRVDAEVMAENKQLKTQVGLLQRDIRYWMIVAALLIVAMAVSSILFDGRRFDDALMASLQAEVQDLHRQLDAANDYANAIKCVKLEPLTVSPSVDINDADDKVVIW